MQYNAIRRKTIPVRVGNLTIGGDAPIVIQSMCNTDPYDAQATYGQILELARAGCQMVRVTVPTMEATRTVEKLREMDLPVPLVADIHFDYRIALRCAEIGIDKIRINPGNIGDDDRVAQVCRVCREKKIPIRIGVNSGSLEKHILEKYGSPVPDALVESALYHCCLLEKYDFDQIVLSIKASSVQAMVEANRKLAGLVPYPLHLGVTEAGSPTRGLVKSAAGIGGLLSMGIGDTIRVSLTADPVREITAARQILQALEVEGQTGMDLVSCPTCGRTQIDLISLVERFEREAEKRGLTDRPCKVAIMGCIVNGPGEAREADFGVAGGKGEAIFFRKGQIVRKIKENEIIETLLAELEKPKA